MKAAVLTLGMVVLGASQAFADPKADYDAALDIVNARRVADYPRAVALLRSVASVERPEGLHIDARAYLDWIECEVKMKLARLAWERGEKASALRLGRSVLVHEVLGPQAQRNVRDELRGWERAAPPRPAADAARVRTTSGREAPRAETLEVRDAAGRPHHLWMKDPAALRTSDSQNTTAAPRRDETILDILARLGAQDATPVGGAIPTIDSTLGQ